MNQQLALCQKANKKKNPKNAGYLKQTNSYNLKRRITPLKSLNYPRQAEKQGAKDSAPTEF